MLCRLHKHTPPVSRFFPSEIQRQSTNNCHDLDLDFHLVLTLHPALYHSPLSGHSISTTAQSVITELYLYHSQQNPSSHLDQYQNSIICVLHIHPSLTLKSTIHATNHSFDTFRNDFTRSCALALGPHQSITSQPAQLANAYIYIVPFVIMNFHCWKKGK